MNRDSSFSDLKLWLHSLAPSVIGLLLYVVVAFVAEGLHLLGISLSGQAFPVSFNDYFLQGYTNFVLQPLMVIINSQAFNVAMTVLFWATIGLIVYAITAYVAGNLSDWRNTSNDVAIPRAGTVVFHPLRRTLMLRLLWRLFIGFLVLILTACIVPVVSLCLAHNEKVLATPSALTGVSLVAINIGLIMAICHGYVILLRLYLLRTRVFGELLY
jgi:hypothetical protein